MGAFRAGGNPRIAAPYKPALHTESRLNFNASLARTVLEEFRTAAHKLNFVRTALLSFPDPGEQNQNDFRQKIICTDQPANQKNGPETDNARCPEH